MTVHHWWHNLCGEYRRTMLWLQIMALMLLVAIVVEVYRNGR